MLQGYLPQEVQSNQTVGCRNLRCQGRIIIWDGGWRETALRGPRIMHGGLHTSAHPRIVWSAHLLTYFLIGLSLFNPGKSPFLLNIYSHLLPNFGDSYILSAAAVVFVPCTSPAAAAPLTQVLEASLFGRPGAFKPMGRGFGNLALTDSSIERPRSLQVQEGWTYTLGPQR